MNGLEQQCTIISLDHGLHTKWKGRRATKAGLRLTRELTEHEADSLQDGLLHLGRATLTERCHVGYLNSYDDSFVRKQQPHLPAGIQRRSQTDVVDGKRVHGSRNIPQPEPVDVTRFPVTRLNGVDDQGPVVTRQ